MLKSIVRSFGGQSGSLGTALIASFGIALAGLSLPAQAQELETFDPDVAFQDTVPVGAQDRTPEEIDATISRETVVGRAAVDIEDGQLDAVVNSASEAATTGPELVDDEFRTAPAFDPVPGMPGPPRDAPEGPAYADDYASWADSEEQVQSWVGNGADGAGETAIVEPLPHWADPQQGEVVAGVSEQPDTFGQDDLIGAAEGVFGKGAKGLAGLIEDLLRKQGQPNGYIVGREAGGAFIFGARYGSGTLFHKVEGERKVYWTGPSLGFDAGANAGNTFVLVYNLYDSEDIFKRYAAGEGQAYLIGGLHASYMRRGDVVLIPIRMGAGIRLGVNAGYMRFSKKHRWLPF